MPEMIDAPTWVFEIAIVAMVCYAAWWLAQQHATFIRRQLDEARRRHEQPSALMLEVWAQERRRAAEERAFERLCDDPELAQRIEAKWQEKEAA